MLAMPVAMAQRVPARRSSGIQAIWFCKSLCCLSMGSFGMTSWAAIASAIVVIVSLQGCNGPRGLSSRDNYKGAPGSDPYCQVRETGGGLRPGVGTVIAMRVGNDRTCLWGFRASGFGAISGGRSARHGIDTVEGGGGSQVVYSYTPNPGYVGSDRFSFSVSRGDGYDNPFTVVVDVVQGGSTAGK